MSRLQTTLVSVVGAAVFLPTLLTPWSVYGDEAAAQQQLLSMGLTKMRGYWICHDEVALRRQLEALPRAERRFYSAREEVRAMLAAQDDYQEQLKQLQEAIEQIRQRIAQNNINPLRRQKLENQVRRHLGTVGKIQTKIRVDLNGRDEGSPLTEATVRLVDARRGLAMVLLAIDRHKQRMRDQYTELEQDAEIMQALGAAGSRERLGPAESYETQERRRIDRLSEAVFSNRMPIYRRGNRYRLSVIVGDHTPATFSYLANQTQTLIPATLVRSAGIELDEETPPITLLLANSKRKIPVHKIIIPRLRIGRYVLENIPALALGPEGEDLGAILGRNALAEYRVELDTHRLEFHMTPIE